jgi:hypothetical protein
MTRKIDEELLKQMAIEIDKFIAQMVVENKDKMHPLETTAVFISRLLLMHRSLGTEQEFKRLTTASLNIQEPVRKKEDAEKPND